MSYLSKMQTVVLSKRVSDTFSDKNHVLTHPGVSKLKAEKSIVSWLTKGGIFSVSVPTFDLTDSPPFGSDLTLYQEELKSTYGFSMNMFFCPTWFVSPIATIVVMNSIEDGIWTRYLKKRMKAPSTVALNFLSSLPETFILYHMLSNLMKSSNDPLCQALVETENWSRGRMSPALQFSIVDRFSIEIPYFKHISEINRSFVKARNEEVIALYKKNRLVTNTVKGAITRSIDRFKLGAYHVSKSLNYIDWIGAVLGISAGIAALISGAPIGIIALNGVTPWFTLSFIIEQEIYNNILSQERPFKEMVVTRRAYAQESLLRLRSIINERRMLDKEQFKGSLTTGRDVSDGIIFDLVNGIKGSISGWSDITTERQKIQELNSIYQEAMGTDNLIPTFNDDVDQEVLEQAFQRANDLFTYYDNLDLSIRVNGVKDTANSVRDNIDDFMQADLRDVDENFIDDFTFRLKRTPFEDKLHKIFNDALSTFDKDKEASDVVRIAATNRIANFKLGDSEELTALVEDREIELKNLAAARTMKRRDEAVKVASLLQEVSKLDIAASNLSGNNTPISIQSYDKYKVIKGILDNIEDGEFDKDTPSKDDLSGYDFTSLSGDIDNYLNNPAGNIDDKILRDATASVSYAYKHKLLGQHSLQYYKDNFLEAMTMASSTARLQKKKSEGRVDGDIFADLYDSIAKKSPDTMRKLQVASSLIKDEDGKEELDRTKEQYLKEQDKKAHNNMLFLDEIDRLLEYDPRSSKERRIGGNIRRIINERIEEIDKQLETINSHLSISSINPAGLIETTTSDGNTLNIIDNIGKAYMSGNPINLSDIDLFGKRKSVRTSTYKELKDNTETLREDKRDLEQERNKILSGDLDRSFLDDKRKDLENELKAARTTLYKDLEDEDVTSYIDINNYNTYKMMTDRTYNEETTLYVDNKLKDKLEDVNTYQILQFMEDKTNLKNINDANGLYREYDKYIGGVKRSLKDDYAEKLDQIKYNIDLHTTTSRTDVNYNTRSITDRLMLSFEEISDKVSEVANRDFYEQNLHLSKISAISEIATKGLYSVLQSIDSPVIDAITNEVETYIKDPTKEKPLYTTLSLLVEIGAPMQLQFVNPGWHLSSEKTEKINWFDPGIPLTDNFITFRFKSGRSIRMNLSDLEYISSSLYETFDGVYCKTYMETVMKYDVSSFYYRIPNISSVPLLIGQSDKVSLKTLKSHSEIFVDIVGSGTFVHMKKALELQGAYSFDESWKMDNVSEYENEVMQKPCFMAELHIGTVGQVVDQKR